MNVNFQPAIDWAKAHGKVTAVMIALIVGIAVGVWLKH